MSCASHDSSQCSIPATGADEQQQRSAGRRNGAPVLTAAIASAPSTPTPMNAATRPMPRGHVTRELPPPGRDDAEQRANVSPPADLRPHPREIACRWRRLAVIGFAAVAASLSRRSPRRRSRSSPRSAACGAHQAAIRAVAAISSAWRPLSTTRPWSSTRMRSAPITLDRRCARISVVRPGHQPVERLLDHRLVLGVDRGQRLVEDQDRRIAQQGAGDREALALAAGQA